MKREGFGSFSTPTPVDHNIFRAAPYILKMTNWRHIKNVQTIDQWFFMSSLHINLEKMSGSTPR